MNTFETTLNDGTPPTPIVQSESNIVRGSSGAFNFQVAETLGKVFPTIVNKKTHDLQNTIVNH